MRPIAVVAMLAGLAAAADAIAEPLALKVYRIESFPITGSGPPKGPLEFLGGLHLTSDDGRFGGLSGIDMLDGETAFMISDSGMFVRARLVHDGGRLVDLADAEIDSLFPDGSVSKQVGDAEDVAFDLEGPRRGAIVRERQANAMLTFELAEGRPTNFQPKPVGAPNRILRSNQGLESVAYAPPTSPAAGEIVAIAERPPRGEADIPGWFAGFGAFSIVRRDDFDVSSARFLPNGDLILLERRYTRGLGIAMRLRRIDGDRVQVGARLDGEVLIEAGMNDQIDNMEGLAIHRDTLGRTVLTLVSDDNQSVLQRTLILQFALTGD